MVEIIFLGRFCDWIGIQAAQKGQRRSVYRRMALTFWCLGEIFGLFAGLTIAPSNEITALPVIYLFALLGAAMGGLVVFLVIHSIKPDPVRAALTAFPTIGK